MDLLTLLDTFKTDKDCEKFFIEETFKEGSYCLRCGHKKIYEIKKNTKLQYFKCASCKKEFSIITNSIFEKTNIGLRTWFLGIHLLNTSSKGISSIQLSKQLKITQKSAWFMLQRLRDCVGNDLGMFQGQVEVDETYVGGKEKNKHSNKKIPNSEGGNNKEVVFGAVERGENKKVKAIHLENNKPRRIQETIIRNIEVGSELLTDESNAYMGIDKLYSRYSCNHSQRKFVVDEIVYNNNVENFWSIFKRGYIGIYHWMSKKHLQRYLNEYVFRYNNRTSNSIETVLKLSKGKRLTYKRLING